MRIGIDFDNTIVCYDDIFCDLAKQWELVDPAFKGTKGQLRDAILALTDGDTFWQRLQGKVYGEYMKNANVFSGFKDFIAACNASPSIKVFIVSHKTEFGHFDENRVNLRTASRQWLQSQDFFDRGSPYIIPEENVFFETTRFDKIARIISLKCTHFIDDLVEVLDSPLFPTHIKRILFQPRLEVTHSGNLAYYSKWIDIKNAFFQA
jgi:hypothetical protein